MMVDRREDTRVRTPLWGGSATRTAGRSDGIQAHGTTVIFIGAPGSGKGTQSSLLASRLGLSCISTGAMLREEAKRDTPAGFRLRQTIANGTLVDDATVCQIVISRLRDLRESDSHSAPSLILDGFPRTVNQARILDELLLGLGMPGPVVVHLDVSTDVLLRRLARRRQCETCGAIHAVAAEQGASTENLRCQADGGVLIERDDDNEGVIARRLAAYTTETLPVVEYYRKRDTNQGVYRRIDGNLNPSEIAIEVRDLVLFTGAALAA